MIRLINFSAHLEYLKNVNKIPKEQGNGNTSKRDIPNRADKACKTNCMLRLFACFPVLRVTSSMPTSIKSKPRKNCQMNCKMYSRIFRHILLHAEILKSYLTKRAVRDIRTPAKALRSQAHLRTRSPNFSHSAESTLVESP